MKNKELVSRLVICSVIGGITVAGCVGSQINKASAKTKNVTQSTANTRKQKKVTYLDYDRFTLLDEAKLPCTFTGTTVENRYTDPYTMTGSFDLNQDGKADSIQFDIKNEDEYDVTKVKLSVNGQTWEDYVPAPGDAYIVDLDTSDSYYELVLYDDGMSGDPTFHFFRYDGKKLKYLDAFRAYQPDALALDGHNHVTAKDSFLGCLDTPMLKAYGTPGKKGFQYRKFNLSKAEHKTYTLTKDTLDGFCGAYFTETDAGLKDVDYTFSEEDQIKLHKGDKITIHKIGEYERYQVQLQDGRKGVLYFWIGD